VANDMKPEERFEILKIIIDKLLIGIIIVIVGFVGNAWLEHYKNDLLQKKTFYEKKYAMLGKLQVAYKDLTNKIFECINEPGTACFENKTKKANIKKALIAFDNEFEQITPFISEQYVRILEKYVWLYGASFDELDKSAGMLKYADFLNDLETGFDRYARCELNDDFSKCEKCFFQEKSYSEVKKMTVTEYFKRNYEIWNKIKKGKII
jgi:hypothetical protein